MRSYLRNSAPLYLTAALVARCLLRVVDKYYLENLVFIRQLLGVFRPPTAVTTTELVAKSSQLAVLPTTYTYTAADVYRCTVRVYF